MSISPHATPICSDQSDVRALYHAYQAQGGALVLETWEYDDDEAAWFASSSLEVFTAAAVSTATSGAYFQPGDLEPSIGQDSDGFVWLCACGSAGSFFLARIEPTTGAIEDWSANVSRPSPGRGLRYPGFQRIGDELFLRASLIVDGTGTVPGDVGFGLWLWSAAEWLDIGGTQDDAICLAWYNSGVGGNSAYQYAAFSLAPGMSSVVLLAAWVEQTNTDLNASQGNNLHFAWSNDVGLTWQSADGVELGISGASGLPIVTGDAGTAGTGAGTLVAANTGDDPFFRPASVGQFSGGDFVVFATRKAGSKAAYIYIGGAWTTVDLGTRGVTPVRGVVYGANSFAIPDVSGWWVTGDRGSTWSFVAASADQMGAGMNQAADLDFLARTGWVRWQGKKLVSSGGSTNRVIIAEANLFGADSYLTPTVVQARHGYAGRIRGRRVQ